MLRKLAADAASKPNDANAWIQLAVAYKQMDRLDDALRTFDHASRLAPDNAALLAEYAEAVATSAPSGNAQRTLALVQRALAIDGEQQKALFFGGLAAVEAGQPELGVGYWERLLKLVPPQSEVAGALANGLSKMQEAAAARRGAGAINRSASVSGEVRVAPSLATKVAADDAVFVIARSSDGSRRPLAVLRLTANKLPAEFRLDDGLSMFPDAKLSGVKQVVIAARVSKSGDAVAQPGDLEGSSAPVAVGSKNVRIIIDRVVPER
jgi:cytochrome c-type biogenesis protein CcmH